MKKRKSKKKRVNKVESKIIMRGDDRSWEEDEGKLILGKELWKKVYEAGFKIGLEIGQTTGLANSFADRLVRREGGLKLLKEFNQFLIKVIGAEREDEFIDSLLNVDYQKKILNGTSYKIK
jgi:hypothetical protein